jgi:DNA processing protein
MSNGSTGCGSQNVGPRTFRALLNHFDGARRGARSAADAGAPRRASAPQICSREQAQREIEACGKFGVALVALGEAHYPHRLQMIDDAPPLIAIRGSAAVLVMSPVAIVGSRNASAAGVKITERLTRGLCELGFATVSGMRAASMPPRTAPALQPAPSLFSPAVRIASIPLSTRTSLMRSWARGSL